VKPAPFRYARPRSLAQALELLSAADHDVKILAGGQSLVPMLNLRLVRPAVLVDLNGVPELDGIAPRPAGGLSIGALVRHAQLATAPLVRERAPLLAEAARHVGHAAIRHRGTLGGSLAHADPAAELPAALLALGADFVLRGPGVTRTVPASQFFRGLLTTALAPDEILTEVQVPLQGPGWGFAEIARRSGDFALAGVVAVLDRRRGPGQPCDSARLVGFGLGDRPTRFAEAEAIVTRLSGAAAVTGAAEAVACDPPTDVHASAAYRRHLAVVLAEDAIRQALTRLDGARGA
jgi:CO/xanthine dehydrogenase FAD-binding subunit